MAKIVKKEVSFESVVRSIVQKAIAEELVREGYRELPPDFDAWKTGDDRDVGWDEERPIPGSTPEPGDEDWGDSGEMVMSPGGGGLDPESSMTPEEREAMVSSLLDMEMSEGVSKKIPLSVLRTLVRESVRRHTTRGKK